MSRKTTFHFGKSLLKTAFQENHIKPNLPSAISCFGTLIAGFYFSTKWNIVMKNSLLITVSAVSMLFLSTSSRAEFISTNYLTENDNQIAFDTETGLEWLKLNVTSGKSISNVMELMNNGEYEGFRFATASEVDAIIEKLMPSLFSSEERYLNDPSSFIVDTSRVS